VSRDTHRFAKKVARLQTILNEKERGSCHGRTSGGGRWRRNEKKKKEEIGRDVSSPTRQKEEVRSAQKNQNGRSLRESLRSRERTKNNANKETGV